MRYHRYDMVVNQSLFFLLFIFCWLVAIGIIWFILRQWRSTELTKLVNQAFLQSANQVAAQNQTLLSSEQERIQADLDRQRQRIEQLVGRVETQLTERQKELHKVEQERVAAFATLRQQLEEQRSTINDLHTSTAKLTQLLDNNQARGQWGERIIEDLLHTNGLVEGVHYVRQQVLMKGLRPDILLLLPDQRSIAIDVKFPLSELAKYAQAVGKHDQNTLKTQFMQTVRAHLKKVSGYIQPEARTLDYAMLFVPNEMVFSFLNQETPEIIEEAMGMRVLLVSPFTFLVVAGTLRESYRNFILADSLHEAVLVLDEFVSEWEKYKNSFIKYGKSVRQIASDYDELAGVRTRQLERKVEKLRRISTGALQHKADELIEINEENLSSDALPKESGS